MPKNDRHKQGVYWGRGYRLNYQHVFVKKRKIRKMPNSDLIQYVLQRELDSVQLSSSDYEWIAKQVKKNEEKRNAQKA